MSDLDKTLFHEIAQLEKESGQVLKHLAAISGLEVGLPITLDAVAQRCNIGSSNARRAALFLKDRGLVAMNSSVTAAITADGILHLQRELPIPYSG